MERDTMLMLEVRLLVLCLGFLQADNQQTSRVPFNKKDWINSRYSLSKLCSSHLTHIDFESML